MSHGSSEFRSLDHTGLIWHSVSCLIGCSRYRYIYIYITHFYCLAVEAGFYSDVVECLPLDSAAQVPFPPQVVGIFLHPVTGHQSSGHWIKLSLSDIMYHISWIIKL